MKIEPFGERLIVKRLSQEERSGLVIPKESSLVKGSLIGRVIHCGPLADFVAVGDLILFAKYSGTELPVDGKYLTTSDYEGCLCMNEENILGRLVADQIEIAPKGIPAPAPQRACDNPEHLTGCVCSPPIQEVTHV